MTVDLTPDEALIASPFPQVVASGTMRGWLVDSVDATRDGPRSEKLVAAICSAVVSTPRYAKIAGVAVSRSWQGQYAGVLFASSPPARELDSLQETLGLGPGPSALREGAPVLVPDLDDDPRARSWVGFVEAVAPLGLSSVYALPIQVGASSLGLLTMHSQATFAMNDEALRDAVQLSDVLAIALLSPQLIDQSAGGSARDSELNKLLDGGHAVTHQAIGMVSVQLGGSVDDALAMLRAHAFATGAALVEVARLVVARELSFQDGEIGPGDPASGAGHADGAKGDDDDVDI